MTTLGAMLYGLRPVTLTASGVDPDLFGIMTGMSLGHEACGMSTFCRNPLHPGPCKGWKRKLGIVSPGALHAIEKARAEKLEAQRKARVEALIKAGQKVPKRLQTPITYDPAKNRHLQPDPNAPAGPTPTQAQAALPRTSTQITQDLKLKRALPAGEKGAAFTGQLLKHLGGNMKQFEAQKDALARQIAGWIADGNDAEIDNRSGQFADMLLKKIERDSGKTLDANDRGALAKKLTEEIASGVKAEGKGTPTLNALSTGDMDHLLDQIGKGSTSGALGGVTNEQLVNGIKMHGSTSPRGKRIAAELSKRGLDLDGKPKAAAPSAPATPSPAAPLPAMASPSLKHAQAVASRSAPGSALAKNHLTAYEKIDKAEFDSLPDSTQKKILSDLDAAKAKFLDPKKQAQAQALIDRFEPSTGRRTPAATGNKPVSHGGGPSAPAAPSAPVKTAPTAPVPPAPSGPRTPLQSEIDGLHAKLKAGDLDAVSNIDGLAVRSRAGSPAEKAHFEAFRKSVEDDASLPSWVRATASMEGDEFKATIKKLGNSSDAIEVARVGARRPNAYPSRYEFQDAMQGQRAELAQLPEAVQLAIRDRRNHMAGVLLGIKSGPSSNTRETVVRAIFPHGRPLDTATFHEFDAPTQAKIKQAIVDQRDDYLKAGSANLASEYQSMEDAIDGTRFLHQQEEAIKAVQSSKLLETRMQAYDKLSPADVKSLPEAHREAIRLNVQQGFNHYDPDTAREARHLIARWDGKLPNYGSNAADNAVYAATIDHQHMTPDARRQAYLKLDQASWNALSPSDQANVKADMIVIADGRLTPGGGLSVAARYGMQAKIGALTGDNLRLSRAGLDSALAADPSPSNPYTPYTRLAQYRTMKKADYDALPRAYKDAINADLEHGIKNSDPNGYALVKAVIDPSWSPPAPTPAPTLPSKPSNTAAMEGALNVLYGIDPKGHTTARQLQAYGVLHKGEFDQFNSVEQQKLLADLSYIATTSKAPNTKKRAQDLIDRFTPAGTPLGTVGQHAVYPPVSSVQGQTRLPEPDGKAGLLKKATNPGQSGDGWLTLPNGGRGPWGKYGAAGLLLRHVDPNDGKERYLMVQRGPGISDPGKWQFPGGAIDSNESPYEGGAREVIEELGFKDSDLLAGRVHGYHEFAMPGTSWKYTSIAATVPDQLKPDLSTHHARAETSDAKWMTIDEIRKLDSGGKLLKPLTGGALERNVVSLFPANATAVARPGPVTRRPGRLAGTPVVPQPPAQALPHKVIKGKNLVATQADQDKLRADVKAVRKNYRGKSADERLSAIAEMQGFDATPTTVSKQEMDRLLATGDYIEMWRGVSANRSNGLSASDINESYRTGTAHYGLGVVGNGYYFATDKAIAEAYSDHRKGSVLRVLLPKSAVIGKYNDVRRDSQNTTSSTYFRQAGRVANGTGTLHDEGRYAAAAGIDAIEVSASKYRQVGGHGHLAQGPVYVLLNRGITIAQEE